MKKMYLILTLFSLLFIISQAGATNGTYLNGFSPFTIGRGGLSYGFYDSPILMMNNPAAVAFLPSSTIEANFSVLMPKLHFTNSLNDKDGESQTFPMFDLAYVHHSANANWDWGFGVFTQGGMGSDFKLAHQLFKDQQGQYVDQEYHSQFGVLEIGPSFVFRGGDHISLGASLHLLYGMMDMWMPYSLSPFMMVGQAMPGITFGQMFGGPATSGGLEYTEVTAFAEMKELKGFAYNGTISMQYKVNDRLTVGTAFTSGSTLKLRNGSALMDMTAQFNDAFNRMVAGALMQMGVDPNNATQQELQMAQQGVQAQLEAMGIDLTKGMVAHYDVETDLKLPAKVGVGFSYRASEMFTFGADLEYIAWSTAFDKMPLKFSNGDNPNVNKMMGASEFDIDFPLQWKDTYVLKLGTEMRFSPKFTGRLGFVHGKNPVPDQTVFPVFPAIVENHLTAGFTANLSEKIAFSGAYELALNKAQTTSESIVAREYVGSTSELMEHLYYVSILFRF